VMLVVMVETRVDRAVRFGHGEHQLEKRSCAIGRLTTLPGHADEVQSLMHAAAKVTRHEDGCLAYWVHHSRDDPNTIVVYESWASPAAVTAHHQTAHMDGFQREAASLVEWPPQQELLTPVLPRISAWR
jgi:quinol monooxygenase YgiN